MTLESPVGSNGIQDLEDLNRSIPKRITLIISIAVPVVVALLFRIRIESIEPLRFLPPVYATLNAITAICLVLALISIKNGKREWHVRLVKVSMSLGIAFLILYIAYHISTDPTVFGDSDGDGKLSPIESSLLGWKRPFYYAILVSHIVLSIGVIPMVLHTFDRGITGAYKTHKVWARITYPVWLYVTISGVAVYWLISPYY